jgi:hypothetical protein
MGEMYMKFWSENPNVRDQPEDLNGNGRLLECILEKQGGRVWTRFMWLRIGTSGGIL